MKKLFTIDDLMVGFIMAIGYGLGFAVPKAMGWPDWQCAVVCWVLGCAAGGSDPDSLQQNRTE